MTITLQHKDISDCKRYVKLKGGEFDAEFNTKPDSQSMIISKEYITKEV